MAAESIALLFREKVQKYADLPAQYSKDKDGKFQPTSFRDLYEEVTTFACGLLAIGVGRGDHVGLISDNRREWLVTDLSLLSLGAADVPRGCDSNEQEIEYILFFADCRLAFAENKRQAEKILAGKPRMPVLETIALFEGADDDIRGRAAAMGVNVYAYAHIQERGSAYRAANPEAFEAEIAKGKPGDLATIIFTSGTTGEPKGVMLSHGNFLYQVRCIPTRLSVKPGDVWLSVLPVWHSFERIIQYVTIDTGSALAYSKPIGSVMLADFLEVRPQWMCSVPRIWESVREGVYRNIRAQGTIKKALFGFFVGVGMTRAFFRNMFLGRLPNFHGRSRLAQLVLAAIPLALVTPLHALGNALVFEKVKDKLGGRFVAGISGGGALPAQVDGFFSALGILILEGYGLTESAPDISVRDQRHPVPGTVGKPLPGTDVRIVDGGGRSLPPGSKGLILVKGPQVMLRYYKKPDLTLKVLSEDGWLNTGDLGMLTREGEIKITGRAKDTIVLRGGENVEPAPIEQKLLESPYISQCVILGQDQRYLAALIVPNQELVIAYAKENNIPFEDFETLTASPEIEEVVNQEVNDLVCQKTGFKAFERVFTFRLLSKPFTVGVELSHKQEVMRHRINELYRKEIASMFR